MRRSQSHRIKPERPETSSAYTRTEEEHDLAYYIHDRVELMHQVFSVLKAKDLRAMAPECVRRLSVDDLEELCTEELLGISSKRLLAILDGAEPPSDTDSSSESPDMMETISLDSISSNEELLMQDSGKKKHKHKHKEGKAKKRKTKKSTEKEEEPERSKASRAGLTVLELLELQARARAIRAQLQQEQAKKQTEPPVESSQHSQSTDDSEVEIKEEPAEVVEISSEDEKPDIQQLGKALTSPKKTAEQDKTTNNKETETNKESSKKKKKDKSKKKDKDKQRKDSTASNQSESNAKVTQDKAVINTNDENSTNNEPNKITKRVNNLIITVPQPTTRKIKLNRNNVTVSIANRAESASFLETPQPTPISSVVTKIPTPDHPKKISSVVNRPKTTETEKENDDTEKGKDKEAAKKTKDKLKKKQKKKEKRKSVDEDHDEITLQLSDSEKMDLLENFDRKDYDAVSSTSSDSENSSSDSDDTNKGENLDTSDTVIKIDDNSQSELKENNVIDDTADNNQCEVVNDDKIEGTKESVSEDKNTNETIDIDCEKIDPETTGSNTDDNTDKNAENKQIEVSGYVAKQDDNGIEIADIDEIPIQEELAQESQDDADKLENVVENSENCNDSIQEKNVETNTGNEIEDIEKNNENVAVIDEATQVEVRQDANNEKEISEGELTDQESSEVEAFDLKPEVVCISDDEAPKKKKKKDKKTKKEKKKKSDFRESADQNFFRKNVDKNEQDHPDNVILSDNDDVYEILELSDDSSCYEVEGTVLSKEPTADEIATLSAKIDELEREEQAKAEQEKAKLERTEKIKDVNTVQKETEVEKEKIIENEVNDENIENISWKDRYLDSKKVKKVLTTSNILNAMRNKNKELKRKMEESKKKEKELEQQKELEKQKEEERKKLEQKVVEEGSIEQFNTLQGSTKYVDPVPDPEDIRKEAENITEGENNTEVTNNEMDVALPQTVVTGEMKKDAKQLLKMYKKLLKYNDMTKQKEPNKKKAKKKKKKEKDCATIVANSA